MSPRDSFFRLQRDRTVFRHREIAAAAARNAGASGHAADAASCGRIDDLRFPPSNRLEALKGDRKGQWSIRINDQWRVCFRFEGGHAYDVEIVDYH